MLGWARFGDAGGRHGLIDAAGIDTEMLDAIRWHTDLPPDAPTTWPNFYAGYAIRDYYVVQFTEPDAEADRSGMVKTTLAAVEIDRLGEMELADLRIHATSANAAAVPPVSCGRLEGLGAVLDLLAESRPVYWLGTSTYDVLLDQLWDVLSTADRADLVFGLLFTPTSVPYPKRDTTFGVYLVPEQSRARFDSTSIINGDDPPMARETGRAVLDGNLDIAVELDFVAPSLREWYHLAQVNLHLNEACSSNPDGLRACAHLLSHLAPGPQRGRVVKARVVALLAESSTNASFSHVRGLRTLDLADLESNLCALVEPWAAAVIGDSSRIDDLQAALDEIAAKPRDQLCVSINTALDKQIKERGKALVDYLKAAIAANRRTVFAALAHRAAPERIDTALASVDGVGNQEWVHEIAQQAQLPMTHSLSCPTSEPIEAFQDHLAIPGHTSESRSQLASRCEPRGVVKAAVALNERGLIKLAAEVVHQDADALLPVRTGSPSWLAIWARAVEDGADPWTWLEPWDALEPVLNALINGDSNVRSLVAELGACDEINLASYPRRAEAWSIVDEPARSRLLNRTARVVTLEGFTASSLESTLSRAVVSQKVMKAIAVIDVSKAVDAIEMLASYADSGSAKAIMAAADLGTDAKRLGELVAREKWKNAAQYIITHAPQRPDLVAAKVACQRILSPLEVLKTKVLGSLGSASTHELSAGIHEIAVKLYPKGPSQKGIWTRAGGNEADIELCGTGRQCWERALAAVTTGAVGAPTLASLIKEMLRDYPKNSDLKIIRKAT
ncbi:MAG: effector-associated domain EAD1-containing protein [Acidimicrobiaceae bacterium]|nr:effector-associated domain EAD1-containing protein [Acidimicrobiaceae bacterium]